MPTIWIDGDACPKAVREIVIKAANRTKTPMKLVANHFVNLPPSPYTQRVMVESGFDKADDFIATSVSTRDVVITSDLPLAEACLKASAFVISPRGERFSLETIKQKLAMRDFNEVMRGSGIHSGGPKPQSSRDINQFANELDRLLAMISSK